jgi:hypothetical protein
MLALRLSLCQCLRRDSRFRSLSHLLRARTRCLFFSLIPTPRSLCLPRAYLLSPLFPFFPLFPLLPSRFLFPPCVLYLRCGSPSTRMTARSLRLRRARRVSSASTASRKSRWVCSCILWILVIRTQCRHPASSPILVGPVVSYETAFCAAQRERVGGGRGQRGCVRGVWFSCRHTSVSGSLRSARVYHSEGLEESHGRV